MSLNDFRILELGEDQIFTTLAPGQTTHFYTTVSRRKARSHAGPVFSLKDSYQIWRELAQRQYSLVALGAFETPLWSRHFSLLRNLRCLFKHLACPASFGPYLAAVLARFFKVPVIAYDRFDTMLIGPANFFLFPFVRRFFKRELPQNKWHVFLHTTPRNGDVSNIRRQPFFQEAMAKVRPFPLFFFDEGKELAPVKASDKQTDIFYAGDNPKTTVRIAGMDIMRQMQESGLRVDLPQERLDHDEFCRRISQAWLVWSPEGSGWECGRHYEALVHGAVPVMNYPTICRYKPLIEGMHGFYYGCEGEDLVRVVRHALENKEKLLQMIEAGREHLRQGYSRQSIVNYVLQECDLTVREKDSTGA